jgi:hypothetical protein
MSDAGEKVGAIKRTNVLGMRTSAINTHVALVEMLAHAESNSVKALRIILSQPL